MARVVAGREHEAFVDLADGAGRRALEDEGVERIEGAAAGQAHQPALGGGGIDVFEGLGVGGVFEVTMGREAVADDRAGRRLQALADRRSRRTRELRQLQAGSPLEAGQQLVHGESKLVARHRSRVRATGAGGFASPRSCAADAPDSDNNRVP